MKNSCSLNVIAFSFSLLFLSGCDTFKKDSGLCKEDDSLLRIDGKSAVTKESFKNELQAMIGNMDPSMLPKETQRKVLDDMIRFKLFVAAAKKEGVDKDPEYKKAFDEQTERLEELLLSRFYEKTMFDKIDVPESDIASDYDANKSKYVKDKPGVLVSGVSFKDKDKALTFYNKIKGKMDEFASKAKKEKDGKFREFGRVSSEPAADYGVAMVPKSIKDAALNLTKLPSVDVVKDGKETWVIYVSDKKEASFYDLDEIKDRIAHQLKVNKFMEMRNKKQDVLKDDFKVEVNEDYFKNEDGPKMPPMPEKDNNDNGGGGETL